MSESPGHRSLNSGSAALEPRRFADAAERGYEPNVQIADKLYQAADILAAQGAAHSALPLTAGPPTQYAHWTLISRRSPREAVATR